MENSLYGYSLDDFRDEAKDLLSRAEGILAEIRESPQDSTRVNALFRVIHSLKGSAAYAGLREVDSFAHLYESLLGDLRNGKSLIQDDVFAVLVRARDYLEDLVFNPECAGGHLPGGASGGPMQQLSMLLEARREKGAVLIQPEPELPESPAEVQAPEGPVFKFSKGIQALGPLLGNIELEPSVEEAKPITHKIVLTTEEPAKMDQKDVIRASMGNFLKSLIEVLKKPLPDKEDLLKVLKKMEGAVLWAFDRQASDVIRSIDEMKRIIARPGNIDLTQLKKEFNTLSLALKSNLSALDGPVPEKHAAPAKNEATIQVKEERVSATAVRGASKEEIVKITIVNVLDTLDDLLKERISDPARVKKAVKRLRDINMWAFNDDMEVGARIKSLESLIRRPYDEATAQEIRRCCIALRALFFELMGEKEDRQSTDDRGERIEDRGQRDVEDEPGSRLFTEMHVPVVEPSTTAGTGVKPAPAVQSSSIRVKSEELDSLISTVGELAGLDPKDFERLQSQVLQLRMVPVGELFSRFRKVVRDISEELGKDVEIEISGESTKLDKVIADRLNEPIMHMVRNAISHGLETPDERRRAGKPSRGQVRLKAFHEGGQIIIEVSDNGRGISLKKIRERALEMGLIKRGAESGMTEKALLDLIFVPGFSTAREADKVSGRGVGMDVVKDVIASLQGTVTIETREGKGTTFRLQLPLTLAVIKAMVLEQSGNKIALPSAFVDRVLTMTEEEIEAESIMDNDRLSLDLAGEGDVLPLVDMAALFGVENRNNVRCVVLVRAGMGQKAALIVDATLGRQPVMVKPLDRFAGNRYFSSAAFVDNELILVLNAPSLMAA